MQASRELTWKYSTTEVGKESSEACSRTCASLRLLVAINCARSPTTLEEGVTCHRSEGRTRRWSDEDEGRRGEGGLPTASEEEEETP